MPSPYGTLDLLDSIANVNQSVIQFGEDNAYKEIQRALDAHNEIVRELVPELCEVTDDQMRRYGGTARMVMEDGDETGQPDVQKGVTGANMGFPLERARLALGWTRDWLEEHTVADLALQYTLAQKADIDFFQKRIQRSIFTPTNNLTYVDHLYNQLVLPVRALLNADGQPVPISADGTEFDGDTHTHYTASLSSAGLTADIVRNVLTNVVEHVPVGEIRIYINRAQEAALWAMTGAFFPYVPENIQQSSADRFAIDRKLDQRNTVNRAVGRFDAAEVWVKPWVPPNYIVAVDLGAPGYKPLVYRTRPGGQNSDLRIRAEHEHFPLRAQTMTRDYGIGVWHRHMIAVHQINATDGGGGVAVYTAPTF
jgi:hypothetical protein